MMRKVLKGIKRRAERMRSRVYRRPRGKDPTSFAEPGAGG